jgi:hypothetical protein
MSPFPDAPPNPQQQSVDYLHSQLSAIGIVPLDQSVPGEVPISALRRSRRAFRDESVGMATLVEVDDVWFWQEGLVTRGVSGRRAGFGLVTLFGGTPLTTVKFEKLGSNQIATALETMDNGFNQAVANATQSKTKNPGLREWKDGALTPGVDPVPTGRILLFVHGTFSNNDNLVAELNSIPEGQQFLTDLTKKDASGAAVNYDQVLTFDHYTVSRNPVLNALELARMMVSSAADVDIICHSRGGLVTRWFMEVFDRSGRQRRRAVLVGSPLHGTSLAAPDRIRNAIDLFTNIGKTIGQGISLIPFAQVAGSLMQIVFSVGNLASKIPLVDAAVAMIPGLASMSRVDNNYELNALQQLAANPPQYFGITSIFTPPLVGWKFWNVFCGFGPRAAAAADSLIFKDADQTPCENDLVVDTVSMTEYAFPMNPPLSAVFKFGPDEHVYHTIYFRQPKTVDFIRASLGIS